MAAPLVVASVMLPKIIADYAKIRPKVTVRLIDCPVESLSDRIATRDVDLAVGPDRPVGPGIERVVLYPSAWVVWCSPRHTFASKETLTWKDLASERLLVAGRDHEIHLSAIFRQLPISSRIVPVQVVDNISSALGLAAAGLCYTISPAYVEAMALPLGLVKRQIQIQWFSARCLYSAQQIESFPLLLLLVLASTLLRLFYGNRALGALQL